MQRERGDYNSLNNLTPSIRCRPGQLTIPKFIRLVVIRTASRVTGLSSYQRPGFFPVYATMHISPSIVFNRGTDEHIHLSGFLPSKSNRNHCRHFTVWSTGRSSLTSMLAHWHAFFHDHLYRVPRQDTQFPIPKSAMHTSFLHAAICQACRLKKIRCQCPWQHGH